MRFGTYNNIKKNETESWALPYPKHAMFRHMEGMSWL